MNRRMKWLVILICVLHFHIGFPQFVSVRNFTQTDLKSAYQDTLNIAVKGTKPITALVVKGVKGFNFNSLKIVANGNGYTVVPDEHEGGNTDSVYSNILVFPEKVTGFNIVLSERKVDFVLYLYHSGTAPEIKIYNSLKSAATITCGEPKMVSQNEWREGLPVPSYTRIVHEVKHLIVHHSATSNSLTNYTNVLRNIYLYHTQTRKWSDIGYNYIIAPDGVVFKGRDPAEKEQDNVMGAHFCASNTGTMGACMLGNYTTELPTDTAMASLEKLFAWKVKKNSLDPLGTAYHPLNRNLSVVSGHRDGCSTICPGNGVYNQLSMVRSEVEALIEACNNPPIEYFTIENPVEGFELKVKSPYAIHKIDIFDMCGKKMYMSTVPFVQDFSIPIPTFKNKFILMRAYSDKKVFVKKLLIVD